MTKPITNVRPALGDTVEITLDDATTRTIVVDYVSENAGTFGGTTLDKHGLPTPRYMWAALDMADHPYGVCYGRRRSAGTRRQIAAARIVLTQADRIAIH